MSSYEPSADDVSSVDPEVTFSPRAYSKMILHAAKYPHCAINGLLLAKSEKTKSHGTVHATVVDCIPLFHQVEGLTPMVEVALAQIEASSAKAGLYIYGYYHANRALRDISVNVFSQRIAEKVSELSLNNQAILVTIDNRRLGLALENHGLIVQMSVDGKWRRCAAKNIHLDDDVLEATSNLLQNRAFRFLVDFDNHLDDITQDYLNVTLNLEIEKRLS